MPKYRRGTHQRWYRRRAHYFPKEELPDLTSSEDEPEPQPMEEREELVVEVPAPASSEELVESEIVEPEEPKEPLSPKPVAKLRQSQLIGAWLPAPTGYQPPPVPKKPKKAKAPKFALGDTVKPRPPTPPTPGLGLEDFNSLEDEAARHAAAEWAQLSTEVTGRLTNPYHDDSE